MRSCIFIGSFMNLAKPEHQSESLSNAVPSENVGCFSRDTKDLWIIEKDADLEPLDYQFCPLSLWYLWLSHLSCRLLLSPVWRDRSIWQENIEIPSIPPAHKMQMLAFHFALGHLYYYNPLIRVWVLGRVVWNEERSPACWINGVNNSLWRFSDYALTDSPHSTGRQTKTAQSKLSTHRTHIYIQTPLCTLIHTHTNTQTHLKW